MLIGKKEYKTGKVKYFIQFISTGKRIYIDLLDLKELQQYTNKQH